MDPILKVEFKQNWGWIVHWSGQGCCNVLLWCWISQLSCYVSNLNSHCLQHFLKQNSSPRNKQPHTVTTPRKTNSCGGNKKQIYWFRYYSYGLCVVMKGRLATFLFISLTSSEILCHHFCLGEEWFGDGTMIFHSLPFSPAAHFLVRARGEMAR